MATATPGKSVKASNAVPDALAVFLGRLGRKVRRELKTWLIEERPIFCWWNCNGDFHGTCAPAAFLCTEAMNAVLPDYQARTLIGYMVPWGIIDESHAFTVFTDPNTGEDFVLDATATQFNAEFRTRGFFNMRSNRAIASGFKAVNICELELDSEIRWYPIRECKYPEDLGWGVDGADYEYWMNEALNYIRPRLTEWLHRHESDAKRLRKALSNCPAREN